MKLLHILTYIKNYFNLELRQRLADEEYLANSTSLVDLERRMKELDNRGTTL